MSELDSVVSCEDMQLGTTGCVYVTVGPLAPVYHDNTVVEERKPMSRSYSYIHINRYPIAELVVPWSQFFLG